MTYWKLREDPKWLPYCLMCDTLKRMERTGDTFKCRKCGNVVDEDMKKVPTDTRSIRKERVFKN